MIARSRHEVTVLLRGEAEQEGTAGTASTTQPPCKQPSSGQLRAIPDTFRKRAVRPREGRYRRRSVASEIEQCHGARFPDEIGTFPPTQPALRCSRQEF